MKSVLAKVGVSIIIIAAASAFLAGLIWLVVWDSTNDAKSRQETCKQIAELAKAESYVEKSYSCFLVKDGKIVEIK